MWSISPRAVYIIVLIDTGFPSVSELVELQRAGALAQLSKPAMGQSYPFSGTERQYPKAVGVMPVSDRLPLEPCVFMA